MYYLLNGYTDFSTYLQWSKLFLHFRFRICSSLHICRWKCYIGHLYTLIWCGRLNAGGSAKIWNVSASWRSSSLMLRARVCVCVRDGPPDRCSVRPPGCCWTGRCSRQQWRPAGGSTPGSLWSAWRSQSSSSGPGWYSVKEGEEEKHLFIQSIHNVPMDF